MSGSQQRATRCKVCGCALTHESCRNIGLKGKQPCLCRKCESVRSMFYQRRRQALRGTSLKQDNKRKAVEYKGRRCSVCGLVHLCDAVYEFHHLDPTNKKVSKAGNVVGSQCWAKLKAELDKCVILCANCHRVLHYGH